MHLPLRPIFRQSHPNFRGGRNANASEIWAQLTKNLLTKSGTERFRENIMMYSRNFRTRAGTKRLQEYMGLHHLSFAWLIF